MCGVAGLWAFSPFPNLNEVGQAMTHALLHRGPDSNDQWSCSENGVSLGHARLAIIDVSAAGAQPMHSHCGRYVVTYNGEIYNHNSIRSTLEQQQPSIQWAGTSDTETLLAAISAWGFDRALEALTGMYVIALWDKQEKTLSLARDRMGEKPLYYGWVGQSFVFASELKAISKHPEFQATVNQQALRLYIEKACVPAPHCIFEGLHKLPPAAQVCIRQFGELPVPTVYWALDEQQARSREPTADQDIDQWLNRLDDQLSTSIEMQMASDVPLGAFLSGGYDSSLVVAMMQKQSSRKVRTFSIGFDNPAFDEAPYAKAVAEHLGTEHSELYVSADDALALIPRLPTIWDEPFADPSQLPTYMVSAMTREHVTVSLSGDGGDELFGGYTRYEKTASIWNKVSRIPGPLRTVIDKSLSPLLTNQLHRQGAKNSSAVVGRMEQINRTLHLCGSSSREVLYDRLIRNDGGIKPVVKGQQRGTGAPPTNMDFLDHMILTDINDYLHNTILTKVDRAAMAVSLETRAPLLDHHLVELAWVMPNDLKVRNQQSKWCLKSVLHKYVPQSLMDRPKKGFGIPLADWLRGPLKQWADDLLSVERLTSDGYFNTDVVRGLWDTHQAGNWQHDRILWNVLMFQAWLDSFSD